MPCPALAVSTGAGQRNETISSRVAHSPLLLAKGLGPSWRRSTRRSTHAPRSPGTAGPAASGTLLREAAAVCVGTQAEQVEADREDDSDSSAGG